MKKSKPTPNRNGGLFGGGGSKPARPVEKGAPPKPPTVQPPTSPPPKPVPLPQPPAVAAPAAPPSPPKPPMAKALPIPYGPGEDPVLVCRKVCKAARKNYDEFGLEDAQKLLALVVRMSLNDRRDLVRIVGG